MARAFILSPKLSDASSLVASTSVANAVAGNMLLARPKLYWRSTNITPNIVGNFGSPKTIDTIVHGFMNGRSGDKFRLRLATTEAGLTSAPGFDSDTIIPGGVTVWPVGSDLSAYLLPHRVWTFTQQTYQYYRVDYAFGSNPLGYVQCARVALGKRIEPVVSIQSKWGIAGNEDVAETVDMGGEESPRAMGTRRSITVTWHDLTESERESVYAALLERGSARDIVLAIEPSEGKYAMSRVYIGRVKQAHSFQQTAMVSSATDEDNAHHFTVTITVTEMAPIEMV